MSDYAGSKQDDDRSTSGKSARTRCLPETIRHNPPVGICCEAGEQGGVIRRGAGGAKGWDQGECKPPAHGPNAEPGNCVTGAGAHTSNRKGKEKEQFTALFHHINVELLRDAFFATRREAAPGADGVTWQDYAANLERDLQDLHARVQRGAYRALPFRRQYIPKPDGRRRPLAVATATYSRGAPNVVSYLRVLQTCQASDQHSRC